MCELMAICGARAPGGGHIIVVIISVWSLNGKEMDIAPTHAMLNVIIVIVQFFVSGGNAE